jgi:nickel transport protein
MDQSSSKFAYCFHRDRNLPAPELPTIGKHSPNLLPIDLRRAAMIGRSKGLINHQFLRITGMKAIIVALLLVLTTLGFPKAASAHVLQADYSLLQKSQLEIQAKFNTGEPYPFASVQVFAPKDDTHPWLESKADAQGRFEFIPDRSLKGDWTVKVGKSDHADILTIPVTERGVEVNEISQGFMRTLKNQIVALSCAAFTGIVGTRFFSLRQLRR